MSQGTPTREGRIERHLMRQRGAGVRNITADFGFSFALPANAPQFPAPVQLPLEPPAKRRKTEEIISPKQCKVHPGAPIKTQGSVGELKVEREETHAVNESLQTSGPSSGEPKATTSHPKKPTRGRRKLKLDDDLGERQQNKKPDVPQHASVEDTFISGLKPAKRRPKREDEKAAVEEPIPENTVEQPSTAPAKRKAKRTTKQQSVVEPVAQNGEPEPCIEMDVPLKAAKSKVAPKRANKSAAVDRRSRVTSSDNEAIAVDTERQQKHVAKTDEVANALEAGKPKSAAARDPKRAFEPVITDIEGDIASESAAKKTSQKSIEQVAVEVQEHVAVPAEQAAVKKPTKPSKAKLAATKTTKRSIDQVTAEVREDIATTAKPATKRPRRQAAISATQRVTSGYEEELIPADKLRRAPDPVIKCRRQKKETASEVAPPLAPSPPPSIPESVTDEAPSDDRGNDVSLQAPGAKRGRNAVAAVPTDDILTSDVDEMAKRSRITSRNTSSAAATETKKARPKANNSRSENAKSTKRKGTALEMGASDSPQRNADKTSPSDESRKPNEEIRAEAQGKECRKATNNLDEADQASLDEKPTAESSSLATETIPETQGPHVVARELVAPAFEQVEEPRKETTKKRPTKARRALAESDVNVVRPSPVKATEKKHPKYEKASAERKDRKVGAQPTGSSDDINRSCEAKPAGKPSITPEIETTPCNPSISKEGRAIAGDENIGSHQPPDRARGPKRSRKVQPVQQTMIAHEIEAACPNPSISKKTHVIAKDEDIDWLFDQSETKRSRPATIRHATSKVRRKGTGDGEKEIDLDDLLESVAGFSGKQVTGKRGLAVAS